MKICINCCFLAFWFSNKILFETAFISAAMKPFFACYPTIFYRFKASSFFLNKFLWLNLDNLFSDLCQCCSSLRPNSFNALAHNSFIIAVLSFIGSICFQFFTDNNIANSFTIHFFFTRHIRLACSLCGCN